jgi:uncharacterized protein YydD (DUF2326 family)
VITAVRANKSSFHPVQFGAGLNLILAERTKESTKKDSRNGLGKSTLIEIIHFCMGARALKGQGVVRDELSDWIFTVDLNLDGQAVSLERSVGEPAKIHVTRGEGLGRDTITMKPDDLNRLLGQLAFGLPYGKEQPLFSPSFRSLVSYLVRRGPEAFTKFQEHHSKQAEWDKQVNLAYLLDIDWDDAREAQLVKEDAKTVSALKRAAKSQLFTHTMGSEGELEVARVRLGVAVEADRQRLRGFRVHEDYRLIEVKANELTERIHKLSNDNQQDRQFLALYEQQLVEESASALPSDQLQKVYGELGFEFPGRVKARLDQVDAFHAAVVENRRSFLEEEIRRLQLTVAGRDRQIEALDAERASQMMVLRTHGALEEYQTLQARVTDGETRLGDIEARIARLRELGNASTQLGIRKQQVERRTRIRFDELKPQRDRAIRLFNENTEALYQVPGNLIIDVGPSGIKFDVEIERAESEGVSMMKILCFDLMLSQLWVERTPNLGFLIHDSTLYDPVDERQVASALRLARSEAERLGFQYICALNSDKVPTSELPAGFVTDQEIAVTLTDRTEDGTLLGQRF